MPCGWGGGGQPRGSVLVILQFGLSCDSNPLVTHGCLWWVIGDHCNHWVTPGGGQRPPLPQGGWSRWCVGLVWGMPTCSRMRNVEWWVTPLMRRILWTAVVFGGGVLMLMCPPVIQGHVYGSSMWHLPSAASSESLVLAVFSPAACWVWKKSINENKWLRTLWWTYSPPCTIVIKFLYKHWCSRVGRFNTFVGVLQLLWWVICIVRMLWWLRAHHWRRIGYHLQ